MTSFNIKPKVIIFYIFDCQHTYQAMQYIGKWMYIPESFLEFSECPVSDLQQMLWGGYEATIMSKN